MNESAPPIHAVILGNDAILAARPAHAVQLVRACHLAGFDLVVPVSWGEELVAVHAARQSLESGARPMVLASCPFVVERLRQARGDIATIHTVSPPVACARYLRDAFAPRPVAVTFVGGCPGAAAGEVDVHLLPDVLLSQLVASGIDITALPGVLDARLPMERARYASLPGGAPDPDWLAGATGGLLVETDAAAAAAVAEDHAGHAVLLDLARASRCTCARDRAAVARAEPPRATAPVVRDLGVTVDLPGARPRAERVISRPPVPAGDVARPGTPRVAFAEHGFEVEAEPPERLTHVLTTVMEPWSDSGRD